MSETFARRVVLLSGGISCEREVSLASGEQVAIALEAAGHEVTRFDPAETELTDIAWSQFDCAFLALHGGAGEDGRVQEELELLGVPFTGSGPAAARLAMSKSAAKERFLQSGVPTLPFFAWSTCDALEHVLPSLQPLGFPLVIKPEGQGSSLGVQVAHRLEDVATAAEIAARYDDVLLAERFVSGREFTVSLLGDDPLPLVEIVAGQSVFSYEAKYSSPTTQYLFPNDLPAATEAALYGAALNAAKALGTAGLARVDLLLEGDATNAQIWVLEVNTIPGLTARSLAPLAARAAGIEMPALCDWMVRDALARAKLNAQSNQNAALEEELVPHRHLAASRFAAAHAGHALRRPFFFDGDEPDPTSPVEHAA